MFEGGSGSRAKNRSIQLLIRPVEMPGATPLTPHATFFAML